MVKFKEILEKLGLIDLDFNEETLELDVPLNVTANDFDRAMPTLGDLRPAYILPEENETPTLYSCWYNENLMSEDIPGLVIHNPAVEDKDDCRAFTIEYDNYYETYMCSGEVRITERDLLCFVD